MTATSDAERVRACRPGLIVVGTALSSSWAAEQSERASAGDPSSAPEPLGLVLLDSERGDPADHGCELPVLGTVSGLARVLERFEVGVVLLCLPIAMREAAKRVRSIGDECGVSVRELTLSSDVVCGRVGTGDGVLDLETLIGRAPREIDAGLMRATIAGRRVLITGAGGSIGSEIARICAGYEPSELFLMDRSDNALFEIDRELGERAPRVARRAVLHDVVDSESTLRRLFSMRPELVFHAAAHKHVPLMEDHPGAAIGNNLFGTKSVADAAVAVGADRFVLISSDKAVRPTSVMGATKRMAELYVRSLNSSSSGSTRFSLVRFGNVLGSSCSVLTIWEKQLSAGGPITVTDRRMTRYFMTIPEAASLVIQSAAITDHDVFVLDMGEPIAIVDLARRYLLQRGFDALEGDGAVSAGVRTGRPTVEVVFTGTRPGEKLYEELSYDAESLASTRVCGVLAWPGGQPDVSRVREMVAELGTMRSEHDAGSVIRAIRAWIPMEHPLDPSDIRILNGSSMRGVA